jgi:hypothetical protein
MVERDRLPQGQLKHLLAAGGEAGRATVGRPSEATQVLLDPAQHLLDVDADGSKGFDVVGSQSRIEGAPAALQSLRQALSGAARRLEHPHGEGVVLGEQREHEVIGANLGAMLVLGELPGGEHDGSC